MDDNCLNCMQLQSWTTRMSSSMQLTLKPKTYFLPGNFTGEGDIPSLLLSVTPKTFETEDSTTFCWSCSYFEKTKKKYSKISKNIDLNPQDINGWTIFVFTCKHGQNDVVKLLVQYSIWIFKTNVARFARTSRFWVDFRHSERREFNNKLSANLCVWCNAD